MQATEETLSGDAVDLWNVANIDTHRNLELHDEDRDSVVQSTNPVETAAESVAAKLPKTNDGSAPVPLLVRFSPSNHLRAPGVSQTVPTIRVKAGHPKPSIATNLQPAQRLKQKRELVDEPRTARRFLAYAQYLSQQLTGNAALYRTTLTLGRLNRLTEIKHHLLHGRITWSGIRHFFNIFHSPFQRFGAMEFEHFIACVLHVQLRASTSSLSNSITLDLGAAPFGETIVARYLVMRLLS